MMTVIVDTNVPKVANGFSEQASEDCVEICVERLEQITTGEMKLALDDQRRIIDEYRRQLNPSGQPGFGDAFLKWVEINWTNPEQCNLVEITPVAGPKINFEEFPDDSRLDDFDDDDRKFIAVACAHPERPPIWQAVDGKWEDFLDVLRENSVTVEYICEDYVQNP